MLKIIQKRTTYPTLLSSSSSSSKVSMLFPTHLFVLPVVDSVDSWWQFTSHSASSIFNSGGRGFGRNLLRPKPIQQEKRKRRKVLWFLFYYYFCLTENVISRTFCVCDGGMFKVTYYVEKLMVYLYFALNDS